MFLLKPKLRPVEKLTAAEIQQELKRRVNELQLVQRRKTKNLLISTQPRLLSWIRELYRDIEDSVRDVLELARGDNFESRYEPDQQKWPEMADGTPESQAIFRNQVEVYCSNKMFNGWLPFSQSLGDHNIAWFIFKALDPDNCNMADSIEFISRPGRPITKSKGRRNPYSGAPVSFYRCSSGGVRKMLLRGLLIGLHGKDAIVLKAGGNGFSIEKIDLSDENLMAEWL